MTITSIINDHIESVLQFYFYTGSVDTSNFCPFSSYPMIIHKE